MLEYDINELKEDQARLPHGSSESNFQYSSKQINTLLKNQTEEIQSSIIPTESGQNELVSSESKLTYSAIYPEVQQYIDQVVQPLKTPPSEVDKVPKRKRQRRVYVAEVSRCASLRSRQAISIVITAPEKPLTPPPAQASPTPTEDKYIKPDQFKPEFWNRIEEEPEAKLTGKKKTWCWF